MVNGVCRRADANADELGESEDAAPGVACVSSLRLVRMSATFSPRPLAVLEVCKPLGGVAGVPLVAWLPPRCGGRSLLVAARAVVAVEPPEDAVAGSAMNTPFWRI